MKLKIFSDRKFLPPGIAHEPIFYPFWGASPKALRLPGADYYDAFDRYLAIGAQLFEMSALEAADLVIFPGNLERVFCPEYLSLATDLAEQAKQAGKPTLGFFWGDCSDKKLPVPCDIVLRNSLYGSTRRSTDFAYPSWTMDFTERYFDNCLPVRSKVDRPTVGFCGFLGTTDHKLLVKRCLYQLRKLAGQEFPPPHYSGHLLRKQALAILSNSQLVEPNFIVRDNMGFVGQPSKTYTSYHQTYVENMQQSDYILCCRGYGNYSFRLYEALSCGKIPVLIDTDCVLPYELEIDWKKYCVWIEPKQLPLIAEKIAEFHDNLSPQEFVDLQYECQRLWRRFLTPEGFFANLHHSLAAAQRPAFQQSQTHVN